MSDEKIQQEMLVAHKAMAEAVAEWSREVGLSSLSKETQEALVSTFQDGYGACLNRTLRPAVDLSMVLLQMISLQRDKGANDFRISAEALGFLENLCHKIAGIPEQWQLDDVIETINAEELPDEEETE